MRRYEGLQEHHPEQQRNHEKGLGSVGSATARFGLRGLVAGFGDWIVSGHTGWTKSSWFPYSVTCGLFVFTQNLVAVCNICCRMGGVGCQSGPCPGILTSSQPNAMPGDAAPVLPAKRKSSTCDSRDWGLPLGSAPGWRASWRGMETTKPTCNARWSAVLLDDSGSCLGLLCCRPALPEESAVCGGSSFRPMGGCF